MKTQILKIQMPIVQINADTPFALMNNKNHSIWSQIPLDKVLKKFMGRSLKKYIYGFINKDKKLCIEGIAKNQDW